MTKLLQMSEEGLASFFSEVIKNDGMRRALGRAGEHFLANKSRFDRNIENLARFRQPSLQARYPRVSRPGSTISTAKSSISA